MSTLPTLDHHNYTYWRCSAHGFEDILLCDSSSISRFVESEASSSIANLAVIDWHRHDQFLLSWLLSSIAESMLGHVSRYEHSFQVWKACEL
ncbi:hypothetical protein ACS0TY_031979 [Phlomoides rotata]